MIRGLPRDINVPGLMLVINSEAVSRCCVLYLQAAEPGTFAAFWIKCQAAPQSVSGGPCPQVLESCCFMQCPVLASLLAAKCASRQFFLPECRCDIVGSL